MDDPRRLAKRKWVVDGRPQEAYEGRVGRWWTTQEGLLRDLGREIDAGHGIDIGVSLIELACAVGGFVLEEDRGE